jgi:hypothetical protein
MIEKTLEEKLIVAVANVITDVQIIGFWQDVPDGETAKKEPPFIAVTVKPKKNSIESLPFYECEIDITAVSKEETDPRKAYINAWGAALSALIDSWNGGPNSLGREALKTALDASGEYDVSSVLDNGGDCGYNDGEDTWFVTKALTITFTA